jgi:hypothetical protein
MNEERESASCTTLSPMAMGKRKRDRQPQMWVAWRAADSLALRDFIGVSLEDTPPDHSTISRTRRLIDLETHRAVFTWVLQCLSMAGLVKGKTVGIDATTLEANAALRSIVRRDTGEPPNGAGICVRTV